MKSPDPLYVFRANSDAISSVCFDLSGSRLFYGDGTGIVKEVSLATKRGSQIGAPAHTEGVLQLEVAMNNRLLRLLLA